MKPAAFTEEEWDTEMLIWKSDHICSSCGEALHLTDELFLLQVVYPGYTEQGTLDNFIVQEVGGYYLYDPQFFHVDCWEDLLTEYRDIYEEDEEQRDLHGVAKCTLCSSDIRAYEISGMLSFGELRRSRRFPDGQSTIYFDPCGKAPELICLLCLWRFNTSTLEMWEEIALPSCEDGLEKRCWRNSSCTLGCQLQRGAAE